jgi:hypothetical protein
MIVMLYLAFVRLTFWGMAFFQRNAISKAHAVTVTGILSLPASLALFMFFMLFLQKARHQIPDLRPAAWFGAAGGGVFVFYHFIKFMEFTWPHMALFSLRRPVPGIEVGSAPSFPLIPILLYQGLWMGFFILLSRFAIFRMDSVLGRSCRWAAFGCTAVALLRLAGLWQDRVHEPWLPFLGVLYNGAHLLHYGTFFTFLRRIRSSTETAGPISDTPRAL